MKDEPGKCWLYVKCPECGYDTALWKMMANAAHGTRRGLKRRRAMDKRKA